MLFIVTPLAPSKCPAHSLHPVTIEKTNTLTGISQEYVWGKGKKERKWTPTFRIYTARRRGIVWLKREGQAKAESPWTMARVSQAPRDIHVGDVKQESGKNLQQQELQRKLSFLQKQLVECPLICGLGKLERRIITYQIFYRELKLFNFTKGLIISFHFIHILCQVLKNKEKGTKRSHDKTGEETKTVWKKTHH